MAAACRTKARILSVMKDDSLSREQKHCLAQAIYLERMQEEQKVKIKSIHDGSNERTFHSSGHYGCSHYKRNCRIKAECCQTFFTCRLCHDEECNHKIDRYATRRMMCMFCLTEQDVSAECFSKECGKRMAEYFCGKCRLFDDEYEGTIFHCDDCGLCRRAESDDYWHCKTCNTCLNANVEDHRCLEQILDQNCPVCNEYLFTSLTPITFPDCLHPMHEACMNSYSRTSSRCPICCRSLFVCDQQNRQIEQYMSQNQMPTEYANHVAEILCNDCLVKSVTKFHFMYHQCNLCNGFNTRILRSGPSPLDSISIAPGSRLEPPPPPALAAASLRVHPVNSLLGTSSAESLTSSNQQHEAMQVDSEGSSIHSSVSTVVSPSSLGTSTSSPSNLARADGHFPQESMEEVPQVGATQSQRESFPAANAIHSTDHQPPSPNVNLTALQQRTMGLGSRQTDSAESLSFPQRGAADHMAQPTLDSRPVPVTQSTMPLLSETHSCPSRSIRSSSQIPTTATITTTMSVQNSRSSSTPSSSSSSSHFPVGHPQSVMSSASHQHALVFSAGHVAAAAHAHVSIQARHLRDSQSPTR